MRPASVGGGAHAHPAAEHLRGLCVDQTEEEEIEREEYRREGSWIF